VDEVLDFYIQVQSLVWANCPDFSPASQTCAVEVNGPLLATIAATLANRGICPITNEYVPVRIDAAPHPPICRQSTDHAIECACLHTPCAAPSILCFPAVCTTTAVNGTLPSQSLSLSLCVCVCFFC
jgi:hypothetical protein